jgi:hypothetical protein
MIRIHAALALLLAAATGGACGDNQTHPAHDTYTPGTPAPLPCLPNLDGQIDASEMKPVIGPVASYLVPPAGTERMVDVAGTTDVAGAHVWDWSTDLADDQILHVQASTLDGKWYAAAMSGGQFTTPFDAAGTTDAVYTIDDQALWLVGLASTEEQPATGQTLLRYGSPIAVLRFPIAPGAHWTSTGVVQGGMLRGLPYAGRDTYDVSADAMGLLELPDLSFTQAHRVRTQVSVEPAVGVPVSTRQVSFLFECFGEVARATSRPEEPNDDFTTAAEVRRLGLEDN